MQATGETLDHDTKNPESSTTITSVGPLKPSPRKC